MSAKFKTNPETAIYFLDSTTPDSGVVPSGCPIVRFRPGSTANGAGHLSDQYNLGPGPRTTLFQWRAIVPIFSGSPTIGSIVELYAVSSDGTYQDGNLGVVDSALSNSDKRRNLNYVGGVSVDASSGTFIGNSVVQLFSQYISLALWNASGANLAPSGSIVILTPIPDEIET